MATPEFFFVTIECMTYNHHAYIENTMKRFCMQKTDFPYLCIVMDDCSTDGTQEVISKYLQLDFVSLYKEETSDYSLNMCQNKTNKKCYFAVFYLRYNHYSINKAKHQYYSRWQEQCKYIAICEGDDYWIDENKLKIQTDFLERNSDYVLVYTQYKRLNNSTGDIKDVHNKHYSGFLTKRLIKYGNFIPTLTVLYRNLEEKFRKEFEKINFPLKMTDKPKWLIYSMFGKIKCIKKRMAVYRILDESASHSKDKNKVLSFLDNSEEIAKYFNKEYSLKIKEKDIEKMYRILTVKIEAKYSTELFFTEWIKLVKDYPFQLFNPKLLLSLV